MTWQSDHVRHWMYVAIEETLRALPWEERAYQAIEFGADGASCVKDILRDVLGERLNYKPTQWPSMDIQHTPYADGQWDIAIADQVLEHVERPWLAAAELARIVKAGGLVIVATPFIHPVHRAPADYWRLAPDGYRVLFPPDLWDELALDMWGDAQQLAYEYAHNPRVSVVSAPGFGDGMPAAPGYGPHTDGLNPIVVWMIARRR